MPSAVDFADFYHLRVFLLLIWINVRFWQLKTENLVSILVAGGPHSIQ